MAEIVSTFGELFKVTGEVVKSSADCAINSSTLSVDVKKYIGPKKKGHFSLKNNFIIQKITATITRIVAACVSGIQAVVGWVMTAMGQLALLVHLQFLGIIAGGLSIIASVIDTFRLVTKLESQKERIEQEHQMAIESEDHKKIKDLTLYKMCRGVEICSKMLSMLSAVVVICSFFIPALPFIGVIGVIAAAFLALIVSLIVNKVCKVDKIEKEYLSGEEVL